MEVPDYVRESVETILATEWASDVMREAEGAAISVPGEEFEKLLAHASTVAHFLDQRIRQEKSS